MRIKKIICSSVVAAVIAGGSGEAAPLRTDINPAMQYYQAFLVTPDLRQEDRDYLFTNDWRGQKLSARFGDLIGKYDSQFKLLRQAGHARTTCDWGIDMSPGPAALLPHLARAKVISQAARLRTMWELQEGRPSDARDDLLAAFALARNVSRDGTLISALVQIAMENIICSIVAENFGQLPNETLKQLADGFAAAPPRGTMAACVPMERVFFHDWMLGRISALQNENPRDESKVMAGIRELVASMESPEEGQPGQTAKRWEELKRASGGTPQGVVKLLRDMEPLYDKLAVILALPRTEYEAQAPSFAAEIEDSVNPFVEMGFPDFQKCRQKESIILTKLAMVQAAIEYKLKGEAGLKSVKDPCGEGLFELERFVLDGVDRGFQLTSTYAPRGFPEVLILVEKTGPAFFVDGAQAGRLMAK